MAKADLSADRLRELLQYDPETGQFTWRVATSNRVEAGDVAGYISDNGYVLIGIDGGEYRAHRLAWLYMTGSWPEQLIDHKNGDRADNRLDNLRRADHSLNLQNMRSARADSDSGVLGVCWDKARGKWKAQIKAAGQPNKHIGRFATREEAQAAYLEAKRKLHEGCTI